MDDLCKESPHTQFLSEVAEHKIRVIRDEGLYKHFSVSKPGDSNQSFEIILFPSHLVITGDMGTYCFSRARDMLQWFVKESGSAMASPEAEIGRWHKSLVSVDAQMGAKKKSLSMALGRISENREFYIAEHPDYKDTIESEFDDLVLCSEDGVDVLLNEMYNFKLLLPDEHHPFSDIDFRDVEAYVSQFAWCCYAINYTIGEYLKSNKTTLTA